MFGKKKSDGRFIVLSIGSEFPIKDIPDMKSIVATDIDTHFAGNLTAAMKIYEEYELDLIYCEFNFKGATAQDFISEIGGLDISSNLFFALAVPNDSEDYVALADDLCIDMVIVKPFNSNLIESVVADAYYKKNRERENWLQILYEAKDAERGKRYQETDVKFKQLLPELKNNTPLQLEVIEFFIRKGKTDNAISLLEKILASDPENIRALDIMGEQLLKKGNATRGLQLLEKANEKSPLNTIRATKIVRLYTQCAQKEVERILNINKNLSEAHLSYLRFLAMDGKYLKGAEYFEKKKREMNKSHFKVALEYNALCRKLGGLK